jgi:hypothetical protein
MRHVGLLVVALLWVPSSASAQRPQDVSFNPKLTYAVSFSGTLGSSNIIQGLAPGRHLLMLSTDLDALAHKGRKVNYRWEFEVLPLVEVSDPHDVQKVTVNLYSGQTLMATSDTLDRFPCTTNTSTGPYYGVVSSGTLTQIGTYTDVQTCSTLWTYAGGVSPLGQRVSFRPGRKLQPYAIANAGFLAASRKIPISTATQFNFTAEVGAGIECFQSAKRSIAMDVRYHHTSNGGRGNYNPGIDNVTFRVSYRMGR